MSNPSQPPGPVGPGGGYPPPPPPGGGFPPPPPLGAYPPPPAPQKGTNGLSIAGFILAFLAAPIGLILSVIGLITAGKRQQKGKGLAIAGIIISVLIIGGTTAIIAAVGGKVATVADPGCTQGKDAIFSVQVDTSSADAYKASVQSLIDKLNAAAANAKHSNVRDAMKQLATDYGEVIKSVDAGNQPSAELTSKVEADGKKIDDLCTIGTSK